MMIQSVYLDDIRNYNRDILRSFFGIANFSMNHEKEVLFIETDERYIYDLSVTYSKNFPSLKITQISRRIFCMYKEDVKNAKERYTFLYSSFSDNFPVELII
jgi:hypothetical protein